MRYLKGLVTALTVTMIGGFIVVVAVVVMRFGAAPSQSWPDAIALPAGTTAEAVTRGTDFLLVVTTDGRVLVFDPDGQHLRQEIEIAR